MAKLGLDPDAMAKLEAELKRDAETISTLTKKLDSMVKNTWWEGSDATKFKGAWDGTNRAALTRIAAELQTTATAVRSNITQQTQASQG